MTLNPCDQETLEILQSYYRKTGGVLRKKDLDEFLRTGAISVKKRERNTEYWQTLAWWESLDDSQRRRVQEALNAQYSKKGRRPRKTEMKKQIEEALDSLKRG